MKKICLVCVLLISFSVILTSCGSDEMTYKDGVYTGTSLPDDDGAYAVVDLTIENGGIADVSFVTKQEDGTIKDSEYGKTNGVIENPDFYDKAQHAVAAMETYEQQLKEAGNLEGVDAISGATISYNQFNEAVKDALSQAQE